MTTFAKVNAFNSVWARKTTRNMKCVQQLYELLKWTKKLYLKQLLCLICSKENIYIYYIVKLCLIVFINKALLKSIVNLLGHYFIWNISFVTS